MGLTFEMCATLAVLVLLLIGLVRDLPTDVLFVGAVVLLAALGIIKPEEAFGGFANSGMLTVGALFIVAAALRETGVMEFVGERFLGHVETEAKALFYMAVVLIPSAMVLNNTPKVALLVPVLIAWCRKRRISPSRLLMPLSFLSILGGTCSLIGTSTNLVVQGLLIKSRLRPMSMFEIGWVGFPAPAGGDLSADDRASPPSRPQGADRAARGVAQGVPGGDAGTAGLPAGRQDDRRCRACGTCPASS